MGREVPAFALRVISEQAPNPDSRITLVSERDALGLQRAALDWRLLPIDRQTVRQALHMFARESGRLDFGRVYVPEWLNADSDDAFPAQADMFAGPHPMGTTRMSSSPAEGVVDSDCRVHGLDNLFVAGSSVFPTGGFSNPTLTIVELALRLGDHLERKLHRAN